MPEKLWWLCGMQPRAGRGVVVTLQGRWFGAPCCFYYSLSLVAHKKPLLSATFLLSTAAVAQAQEFNYQTPPQAIQDLLLAPPTPRVSLASDGRTLALLAVQDFPIVAELAQPELRLAGLRFNPRTNGPSRVSYAVGIKLKKLPNGPETDVKGLLLQPAN